MSKDPTEAWPSFFVYPDFAGGDYHGFRKTFVQVVQAGDESITIEWKICFRTKVAKGKRIVIASLESPKIMTRVSANEQDT